jgi:hypothetical protein
LTGARLARTYNRYKFLRYFPDERLRHAAAAALIATHDGVRLEIDEKPARVKRTKRA